jgi:hypothetical protein
MQAEMNRLFAEGGVLQEGGTVDPVSGNEVPPGAMAEEVRDDIDAKLSEGEFVFPADVVRYWGLEKLMMMRDKAKMGLKKMAEIGQMGNANEVPDGEALHGGEEEMDDEEFSSEIDSIMSEEGGDEDREYAEGGYVVPENEKLYRDAPLKGFEMVPMVNDAGQTIYIPFINGVAQLSIPTGYKVKTAGAIDTPATTTPATSGGGTGGGTGGDGVGGEGGSGGGGGTTSGPGFSIGDDGKATANETSSTLGSIVGGILGFAALGPSGIALGSKAGSMAVGLSNFANEQAAMSFNVATKDTTDPANLTDPMADPGYAAAVAETQGYAVADAVGAEGLGVGNIGTTSLGDLGGLALGGPDAAASTSGTTSLGDLGGLALGADAGTGDGGGGGVGAGSGGGGISAGEGLAKGGLVSKPKKSNSKGLAGRRK